jgi:hypothetical protein
MFPDVRLLIAATLASVLALICGFGLFAAFRVSHDPLTRLPPATAALQIVADKSARLPVGFVAAESFDRRFPIAAPAEPIAAEPDATAAISENKPSNAAATLPQTTPLAADVAPAASSPETATAEAGHESGTTARPEFATGDGEVADAQTAAAETSPADPTPAPAEQKPAIETPPARAEQAILQPAAKTVDPKPDEKTADKISDEKRTSDTKTWHIGVEAPGHTYKSAKIGAAHADEPNAALAASPSKKPAPKRAARARSRTQESKLAPNAGIGGPFVSAPGQ